MGVQRPFDQGKRSLEIAARRAKGFVSAAAAGIEEGGASIRPFDQQQQEQQHQHNTNAGDASHRKKGLFAPDQARNGGHCRCVVLYFVSISRFWHCSSAPHNFRDADYV